MPKPPYQWRKLTPVERAELLSSRQTHGRPWHSPPHRAHFGGFRHHIVAACYEHEPHLGHNVERMDAFSSDFLTLLSAHTTQIFAWCVLPNHYHTLVEAPELKGLLYQLGRLHGRVAHAWNGEENARGRKVFYRTTERAMRSERHYWPTLNYIHHNPVHHGHAARWQNWPWSSAAMYLEQTGAAEAERVWKKYPIRDYGQGWDDPEI
jgi:putative transposase